MRKRRALEHYCPAGLASVALSPPEEALEEREAGLVEEGKGAEKLLSCFEFQSHTNNKPFSLYMSRLRDLR